MSEQIALYGENQNLDSINSFIRLLNTPPAPDTIKINKLANNSNYLPINLIERKLDEFTYGLWQTSNFQSQVVANEIIGTIELRYYHPVAKEWITRVGCASVMVQTAKDKPAIVENKIKNTLSKDFPHLKAECIKNAAKSIGPAFGRNLNRDDDGDFETLLEKEEKQVEQTTEQQIKSDLLKKAITILEKKNITNAQKEAGRKKLPSYSIEKLSNYINENTGI